MDPEFWLHKWSSREIAFHQKEANSLLVKHFAKLSLKKGSRVFVPLCGKTRDLAWLLSQGCAVAGAELSDIAVQELFEELPAKPEMDQAGPLKRWRAQEIDLFTGNIFDLTRGQLGAVDAIYDRAALVALPHEMRGLYSAHLREITKNAPQLLICYEYDQSTQPGPPFSISEKEIRAHYGEHYDLTLLESVEVPGGLKGKSPAREHVWLLR